MLACVAATKNHGKLWRQFWSIFMDNCLQNHYKQQKWVMFGTIRLLSGHSLHFVIVNTSTSGFERASIEKRSPRHGEL